MSLTEQGNLVKYQMILADVDSLNLSSNRRRTLLEQGLEKVRLWQKLIDEPKIGMRDARKMGTGERFTHSEIQDAKAEVAKLIERFELELETM